MAGLSQITGLKFRLTRVVRGEVGSIRSAWKEEHKIASRAIVSAIAIFLLLGMEIGVGRVGKTKEKESEGKTVTGTAENLPSGLERGEWKSIVEAHEMAKYEMTRTEDGWQGWNPGQQWVTKFDGRGFLTSPESGNGEWSWGLELDSYRSGDRKMIVMNRAGEVRVAGEELTYHWDNQDGRGVEEWYLNNRKGLEHGYRINELLGDQGDERLSLTLKVKGTLVAERSADAKAITFRKREGGVVINYGGLKVWDAKGRDLGAWFEDAGEETIRLVVDARDAYYPITVDPTAQLAYIKASNTDAQDEFGTSVAISGNTVVVGAIGEDSNAIGVNGDQTDNSADDAGAAYVFVRSGTTWSQQAYLKASNTGAGDFFGSALSISGDTIVVGATGEDSGSTGVNGDQSDTNASTGASYVFVRSGTTWSQQAYLKPSNTGYADEFGTSVSISGNTIVVGAKYEDSGTTGVGSTSDESEDDSGAAYVFVRSGTTWSEQAYLKASNTEYEDYFGSSVSISGDTLVVGASGEDSSSMGVNGNQTDSSADDSGAAYVFVRSGTTWTQQAYLKASNPGQSDQFGGALSISGETIVVGAKYEDSTTSGVNSTPNDSGSPTGAAYVFERTGTTWSQQAYLKASNTDAFDEFGSSVAISVRTVVVGAIYEGSNAMGVDGDQTDNSVSGSGAAYVFVKSGTTWSQLAYIKASNPVASAQFGRAVSISGDLVVAGASGESSATTGVNSTPNQLSSYAGAAYVLTSNTAPTITAASGVTRTAGSAGSSSTIATVTDAQTAAGSLTVTVTSANPSNGVTISGISNTAAGTVTANIVAATGASNATFTLQVNDGTATATTTLNVTVALPTVTGGGVTIGSTAGKIPPGGLVSITQRLTNSSSTPSSVTYKVILPYGLTAITGGCSANVGSCAVGPAIAPVEGGNGLYRKSSPSAVLSNQTITWTGAIPANGSVAVTFQVQVGAQASNGTQYCLTTTIGSTTGPSICLTVTAPQSGPGALPLATTPGNQQKPGSVLIYNLYTSAANAVQSDTRITLTNTNPVNSAYVHLFFVDGTTCAVADQFVKLTQNQTVSLQLSDIDPGVTGYIIGVVTDPYGCPIIGNDLIGEAFVKFESGHKANLPAIGVSGLSGGTQICNANSVTATLAFDGVQYNELPRTLAISNLPPPATGNSTMLIVNRIGGDMAVGAQMLGNITGLLFDDIESSQSFVLAGSTCQLRGVLGNNFPRTAPRYTTVIPAGRSGWMKFSASDDQAITGAVINESMLGFSSGHNLHLLTTTNTATLTIPVFPN